MGFFSRKGNKTSSDADSVASKFSRTNSSLKSPPLSKTINGFVNSPSMTSISLPSAPDPNVDPAAYLSSVYAVRERSKLIYAQAQKNQLNHFEVDPSKWEETAAYVVSIIKVRESRMW